MERSDTKSISDQPAEVETRLEIAREYVAAGYSVIPVRADGSKAPVFARWRDFSERLPTDAELVSWFSNDAPHGIGVPGGPASGFLAVIDFEDEGSYLDWPASLPADLRAIAERLPTVHTGGGGRHVWARLPDRQPGGKIAHYAGVKMKIEIRGDGNHAVAPGSPAACHASGRLYEWVGGDFRANPAIEWEAFLAFCDHAAKLDERPKPSRAGQDAGRLARRPAGEDTPGTDFNRRGTRAGTGLFDAGWTWHADRGNGTGFLTRPGKDGGISASVGVVSSRERM